jgi:hypothetical protein
MFFTQRKGWKKISHISMEFPWKKVNTSLFYEAKAEGVHYTSPSIFRGKNDQIYKYRIIVSDDAKDSVLKKSAELEGTEYGYWQNIGIGLLIILRALVKKIDRICKCPYLIKWSSSLRNPWTSGSNCSEIVNELLAITGLACPSDSNDIDPLEIIIRLHEASQSGKLPDGVKIERII